MEERRREGGGEGGGREGGCSECTAGWDAPSRMERHCYPPNLREMSHHAKSRYGEVETSGNIAKGFTEISNGDFNHERVI